MKKLLIIGAGGIANAHVTAIKKIRGVRIASLCDIHRERAERFASSHNLKADIFTRPEEAIHGGGHDYALVLTPADTRLPIVRECAAAGLPVYMEKPPCSSIDDGEEMLRMIEEANVVHGVGFMSRYNESLNKTLDRIRQEKLSVIAITFLAPFAHHSIVEKYPYPFDVSRSGGLVGDQGIHYVDVCRYIAQSEVKSVRAVGTNQTLRRSDQGYNLRCSVLVFRDGERNPRQPLPHMERREMGMPDQHRNRQIRCWHRHVREHCPRQTIRFLVRIHRRSKRPPRASRRRTEHFSTLSCRETCRQCVPRSRTP